MSWSLRLHNGDLVTSGTSLGQITAGSKLVQDLRCAILEPRGTDDMHREFGSVLDGGIMNGVEVPSLIGSTNWELVAMRVEAEIRRICADHQAKQIERSRNDRINYGESTLHPQELLIEVADIELLEAQDKLMARVTIVTGDNNRRTIEIGVTE